MPASSNPSSTNSNAKKPTTTNRLCPSRRHPFLNRPSPLLTVLPVPTGIQKNSHPATSAGWPLPQPISPNLTDLRQRRHRLNLHQKLLPHQPLNHQQRIRRIIPRRKQPRQQLRPRRHKRLHRLPSHQISRDSTTSPNDAPAAASTAPILSKTCRVCAATLPSPAKLPAASIPTCPATNTNPPAGAFIPCEYAPSGCGAPAVLTTSLAIS